jgi:NAD(P)-dependent dehydrogenase (short-subunit alcohol dehydrogenase family)
MKILIVSASGEVGTGVARVLAKNNHTLVLHGNKNTTKLENLAGEVNAISIATGDVRDEEQVKNIVSEANKTDKISGLVYAVGINPSAEKINAIDSKTWADIIAVNLTGAFLFTKYCIPHLRESKSSSIVIISSVFGISSPANRGAYGASKHGLTGLIQSVAKEEASSIRINGVCPGAMWSENVRNIFSGHASSVGISVEEYVKQRYSQIPYGRFLEPNECANVVNFLLSDQSSFLTGEMIKLSGGEF